MEVGLGTKETNTGSLLWKRAAKKRENNRRSPRVLQRLRLHLWKQTIGLLQDAAFC